MDPDLKNFKVNGRTPIDLKAREVKYWLVSDAWWDLLDYFIGFTLPMMNLLRAANTDSSVLHLVYDMWDTMIEEVKKVIYDHEGADILQDQSPFFYAIQKVIEGRWNKSNTPLHCLAHTLFPKYYTQDEEVSSDRIECFQRLFPYSEEVQKVFLEYGSFSGNLESFSETHVMAARVYEDPLSWWSNYGSSTPLLQSLTFKLLSQLASLSYCERNWSTCGGIQTIKRNSLNTERLEALVFIHNNLRLLYRKAKD